MTGCVGCGQDDWTVVEALSGQPLCLPCVAVAKDRLTAAGTLAWASQFLEVVAERALSPTQKGHPIP